MEVLNTDAEGRLVLADAMAYAIAELAPDQIVDVATLTGAARIALGGTRAALYSTSDELAAALIGAGERSGDRLWRMPLPDDYLDLLESPVADLSNVSAREDGAGSITAALFLREFAGGRPWAHLDIAGAARSSSDDGEVTAGATGFGTRLLLSWLQLARPGLTAVSRPQPIGSSSGTRLASALTCSRSSLIAAVSGSLWATLSAWSAQSALSNAMIPPGRSRRSAAARYSGYSRLSASQNTRS